MANSATRSAVSRSGDVETVRVPMNAVSLDTAALHSARLGARAYELMNSGQATTTADLSRALVVPEPEVDAAIYAYLYVTTGYDLTSHALQPRRSKRSALAVA